MSQHSGNESGQGEQGHPAGQGSASEFGGEQWQHRDQSSGASSASTPPQDPYGATQYPPPSADQYGQPSADQYGQPSANQYGQPSANQYGQPSANQYNQPSAGEWNQNQPPGPSPYGGQQGQPPPQGMPPPPGGMNQAPPGVNPNQGYPVPGAYGVSPSDEKLWGWLVHVSPLLLGFLGPLIVWLIYKDRSRWIKDNATEALNFSILSIMVMVVGSILTIVGIGVIVILGWYVVMLVFGIQAAIAANAGRFYRYPLNWRLVS